MRISKFTLPALTVAGALALAGCGGGSDGNGNDDPPPPPPPPPGTAKTAEVPDERTIYGGEAGYKITLAAGETKVAGSWWYTCEEGSCSIEIPAGTSVSAVSYTGTGTLTIRDSDHRPPTTTGAGTPQPTEDTSPLSKATLFSALSGSGNTAWADEASVLGTGTLGEWRYTDQGELNRLFIRHAGVADDTEDDGEYIYWGLWDKSTPSAGDLVTDYGDFGAVMGGGKPYGEKPKASVRRGAAMVTSATYTDDNPILHHRESDTEAWEAIPPATLTARLTATFGTTMMVGGQITTSDSGAVLDAIVDEGDIGTIRFRDGAIGDDGKFGGSVDTTGSKRENGSWNGQFFGDTSGYFGTGDARASVPLSPSHAVATFSVRRPEIKNGDGDVTQDDVTIRGAFGAFDNPS